MKFQLGDKVKVLDDDQKGKVVRIKDNQITILNEFGFEESFYADELIPDQAFEFDEVNLNDVSDANKSKKSLTQKEVLAPKEIDLHFDCLVDYPSRYQPFEKLQIQLDKAKQEIELAIAEKRSKIILIHGHGSGRLKNELLKLCQRYSNLEIYDASFRKFNGGATTIEFR